MKGSRDEQLCRWGRRGGMSRSSFEGEKLEKVLGEKKLARKR